MRSQRKLPLKATITKKKKNTQNKNKKRSKNCQNDQMINFL